MAAGALDETRRLEFLAAAADVIAERGYHRTRLADVAAHLGVSAPLIVHYFGTREHLLSGALRYTEDRFYDVIEERLAGITGAAEQLDELLVINCAPEAALDLPPGWTLWFEIWNRAAHDENAAQDRAELDARWAELVAGIIRRGQLTDEFSDRIEPLRAAHLLTALLDGLSVQIRLDDPVVTPDYALALARQARDLVLEP